MKASLDGVAELIRRSEIAEAITACRAIALNLDEGLQVAIADEVVSLLRAGLAEEALRRIECFTRPKWHTEAACRHAYLHAMAEKKLTAALSPAKSPEPAF